MRCDGTDRILHKRETASMGLFVPEKREKLLMNQSTPCAQTTGNALHMPSYPLSILIGCAAIDEIDAFQNLPDGFWRVLTRLVKKISVATPYQSIFARRETLARESGKSLETVGRALRWLEDEGFITREQKARRGLRGSEGHIHPTLKLIEALGIGQRRSAQISANQGNAVDDPDGMLSTAPSVENDGSISAKQVHSLLKKEQSGEPRASAVQKNQPAAQRRNVIIDGKIIPAELAWMASEKGLRVTAILKLMQLARKTKHRLSAIVAVCWEALKPLRGKALFAYLCKLIAQDKDWTFLRDRNDKSGAEQMKQRQEIDLVERKGFEWHGNRYVSKDRQRIWTVEENGRLRLEHGREVRYGRMDLTFVDCVMNGELRRLAA